MLASTFAAGNTSPLKLKHDRRLPVTALCQNCAAKALPIPFRIMHSFKTYIYQLCSTDFEGTWYDHVPRVTVRVPELSSAPAHDYRFEQNYPNPFNPVTSIRYTMKEAGSVMLVITDVLSRVV